MKFLTEKEASVEYRMSVHWFRRARWAGGGPAFVKVGEGHGGRILYPDDELKRFFSARVRRSTSDAAQCA